MKRRNAFTLIEVLVVVAIIALLVAILIPSLQRAKENSIATVCASNQHQIGVALSMYAHNSRAYLPYQYPGVLEWLLEPSRFALEKLLGKNNYHKVFFCPNDDIVHDPLIEKQLPWPPFRVTGPNKNWDTWLYRTGYYYMGNPKWPGKPGEMTAEQIFMDVNKNGKTRDEFICKVDEKGAERIAVLSCRISPEGPREFWRFRHPYDDGRGWSNVLYADAHSEMRRSGKVIARWYEPSPVGW